MASVAPDVSIDHFKWLVDGRSDNQKATLDLYRVMYRNEEKLNRYVDLQVAAQELTGIAFSLWRAVFLSDTTGEYSDRFADATKFLVSLVADNTVLYVTDKNARNWSFRYYLDSATLRLRKLCMSDLGLLNEADLDGAVGSDKDEGRMAQDALAKALGRFERAVDDRATPVPQSV